jgi:hypothetical protein
MTDKPRMAEVSRGLDGLKDIPYVGFTNETLAILPAVVAGEPFLCPRCGETHHYRASDGGGGPALFYRCQGTTYLGAVQYKTAIGYEYRSIIGVQPDVSSGDNARMESKPMCQDCWEEIEGDREPRRLRNPGPAPCWRCGNETQSGIFYLVEK